MADINPVLAAIKTYGDARAAEGAASGSGATSPPVVTNDIKLTATVQSDGTVLAKWTPQDKSAVVTVDRSGAPEGFWSTTQPAGTSQFSYTNFTEGNHYRIGVTIGNAPTYVDVLYRLPSAPSGGSTNTGTSAGTTGSAAMPYPTHPVSSYHMCWPNSGSPRLSATPANINELRLSFIQGDPPRIVGPAAEGSEATMGAELKKLRARGVRITLSAGGQGGNINVGNVDGFVNAIMAFSNNVCPVDGLDWDLEGPALTSNNVVAICSKLRAVGNRGPNFAVTMAPNGGNVDQYLPVAKALNAQGLLSAFGQQFYDAPVSQGAMMGRIDQYVGAGLPIEKYQVGMMCQGGASWWDLGTCVNNYKAAKAKYPKIGGAYHWQAGMPTAVQWANDVGNLVKAG